MTDKKNEDAGKEQPTINPQVAQAALAFLDRATIQGNEAQTMLIVKQAIGRFADA